MLVIEKVLEDIKNIDTSIDPTECQLYEILKNKSSDSCPYDSCDNCLKISLLELAKEYKEPIELTQFEYDLLDTYKKYGNHKIEFSFSICDRMKNQKGYFKGVKDIFMTIEEILENCVVKKDGN